MSNDLKIDIGVQADEFNKSLKQLQDSANSTAHAYNDIFSSGMKLYKDAVEEMKRGTLDLNTSEAKVKIEQLRSDLKTALSQKLQVNFKEQFEQLKGNATAAVGAMGAVYGTVGKYIGASADLEANLAAVGDPLGMSDEQLNKLKKTVQDLSLQTPATTSEILAMSSALTAAGANADNISELTTVANKARIAFGLSGGEAANMTNKLSRLTDGAQGLELMLDKTHAMSEALHTNANTVLLVTNKLADEGAALGFSAEQTAALSGAIASMGVGANGTERTVKRLFESFSKGGGAAFERMGIDSNDFMQSLKKDAVGTTDALLTMLSKYDKQTQLTLAQDLVGKNRAAGLVALANEKGRLREAMKLMNDDSAKGKLDSEQELAAAGFNAQMGIMQNAITNLKTAVGDTLLPIATKIVGVFTSIIKTTTEFVSAHPSLVRAITATFAAFAGYKSAKFAFAALKNFNSMINGGFIDSLNLMRLNATSGAGAFGKLKSALPQAASFISRARMAMLGLNAAMLANPIGLIIGAVSGVGFAIYKNWDIVKSFFSGVVDGFKEAAAPIIEVFKPAISAISPIFSTIGSVISAVWGKISGFFSMLFGQSKHTQEQLEGAASVGKTVGRVIGGAFSLIADAIKGVVNIVKWLIDAFKSAFALAGKLIDKFLAAKEALVGGVKNAASAVAGGIKGAANAVGDGAKKLWGKLKFWESDEEDKGAQKVPERAKKVSEQVASKATQSSAQPKTRTASEVWREYIKNQNAWKAFEEGKAPSPLWSEEEKSAWWAEHGGNPKDKHQGAKASAAPSAGLRGHMEGETWVPNDAPSTSAQGAQGFEIFKGVQAQNKQVSDNRHIVINVSNTNASAKEIAQHVEAQGYAFADF